MLARLGQRLTAAFRATAPDPFVLAVLLTALTFLLAIALGDQFTPGRARAAEAIDFWQRGFWSLLAFGMQMCLILVTGHALASSPPVAALVQRLASMPRSPRAAVALTALVAILAGLINWGLGLIVGAVLARDMDRALRRRGIGAPPGLLAAAGYSTMMVWHGGLSGSAPLAAASPRDLAATVGPELAEAVGGAIPVTQTLLSPLNLIVTGGLVVLVPPVLALMCPKAALQARPETAPPPPPKPPGDDDRPGPLPAWLERSPVVVWLLALPAIYWLGTQFGEQGFRALSLNTANLAFLALGLVLHGSAGRYVAATVDAAAGCAGIVTQFPLYAGIMGMVQHSGLVAVFSRVFLGLSGGTEGGLAGVTFASASLVNLFVPSGGGQWAVQGPIALRSALDAGADPARMVLAVAYGDQLTNMIQPFWALPLLALTGQRACNIVGYAAVAMAAGGLWIGLWLVLW